MDIAKIRAGVAQLESRREVLIRLLEQPDLGTLRLDVNQALEELDDLIAEFKEAFRDRD